MPLTVFKQAGFAVCFALLACLGTSAARADEKVSVGGVDAVLIRPAKPRASVILMGGADGHLSITSDGQITHLRTNSLVRNREAFAKRGFAVLLPDPEVDLAAAVQFMAKIKRPVTLIGTSRGTQRIARGIAAGARPDKIVLTSGFLSDESGDSDNVMRIIGDPALLPPTLVVHHRQDGCKKTHPAGVEPFIAWGRGRARVSWISGGPDGGNPCGADSHHGFIGVDGAMVSAAAGFAGR